MGGGGASSTTTVSTFWFRKGKGVLSSWLTSREGGGYVSKKKKKICLTFELCSHKMFSSFFHFFSIIITVDGSTHYSKWLQPAFQIWEDGQGGGDRPHPSRPLSPSSFLGAARAKFFLFSLPSIFLHFSSLFLLPPLFSLLPSRLLPLTLSDPTNIIWLQIGRKKMRGVRWREGTVDEEWYRIDERKLNLKGGGGVEKKLHKDKGGQWENKYIPILSCTDL